MNFKDTSTFMFMIAFALPFAGIGLFVLFVMLQGLWQWHQMQAWQKTPAYIQTLKLATSSKLEVTYRYSVNGQVYTSKTIAGNIVTTPHTSNSHIYRKLDAYYQAEKPFPGYVNPQFPHKAVIYRQLEPMIIGVFAITGLIFGGAGISIIIFSLINIRRLNKRNKRQTPESSPEMSSLAWQQERIIYFSSKSRMITLIAGTLLWNSVVGLFILVSLSMQREYLAGPLTIPGTIGLVLTIAMVHSIVFYFKYGKSVFIMDNIPVTIGGHLTGMIYLSTNAVPENGFMLRLKCFNHFDGGGSCMDRYTVWKDEHVVTHQKHIYNGKKRTSIPVFFEIPRTAQQTDEANPRNTISWQLEAEAQMPGGEYTAFFPATVFAPKSTVPEVVLDFMLD